MTHAISIKTPKEMVGTTCTHCQRPIYVNEPVKTVTVADEVFDSISSIDVLYARCTHLFCEQCVQRFDFASIAIPIKIQKEEIQ